MSRLPKLPEAGPPIPDGSERIYIQHSGPQIPTHGQSIALVAPETAIRAEDTHKTTGSPGEVVSSSFLSIRPLVFIDSLARDSSIVAREGLTVGGFNADLEKGLFQKCGEFRFFRPSARNAASGIIASLLKDEEVAEEGEARTWGEIAKMLPMQIIVTDEGVEGELGQPQFLAERITLDNTASDMRLVVDVDDEDAEDGTRAEKPLVPILWSTEIQHDTGRPVGTVIIDPLQLTAKGLVDWTRIGFTVAGPRSTDGMVAGLLVKTSGYSRQIDSSELFEEPPSSAEVISINSPRRAG